MDAITPAEAAAALAAYDGLLRRRVQWGLRDRPYEDGMGLDDYLQEARIHAYKDMIRFDPTRGTTVAGWAWRCVRWAASHVTRPVSARRVSRMDPLEALPEEAEHDRATGSEAIEFTLDLCVVRAAVAVLPDRSRDVLTARYLDGDSTLGEVGAACGRGRERIRQIERVGIVELRGRLLDVQSLSSLECYGWWWFTERRLDETAGRAA